MFIEFITVDFSHPKWVSESALSSLSETVAVHLLASCLFGSIGVIRVMTGVAFQAQYPACLGSAEQEHIGLHGVSGS